MGDNWRSKFSKKAVKDIESYWRMPKVWEMPTVQEEDKMGSDESRFPLVRFLERYFSLPRGLREGSTIACADSEERESGFLKRLKREVSVDATIGDLVCFHIAVKELLKKRQGLPSGLWDFLYEAERRTRRFLISEELIIASENHVNKSTDSKDFLHSLSGWLSRAEKGEIKEKSDWSWILAVDECHKDNLGETLYAIVKEWQAFAHKMLSEKPKEKNIYDRGKTIVEEMVDKQEAEKDVKEAEKDVEEAFEKVGASKPWIVKEQKALTEKDWKKANVTLKVPEWLKNVQKAQESLGTVIEAKIRVMSYERNEVVTNLLENMKELNVYTDSEKILEISQAINNLCSKSVNNVVVGE